ncbi:MAG: sel1 repeat family protein [Caulobacteraceae bacterium]|nr:sel1 repeat family protein [Caulobacteraceae bacterium]
MTVRERRRWARAGFAPARFAPALALLALTTPALAEAPAAAPAPAVAPDLRAAMEKADAGTPADLTALADSGRADAQYYAALMYLNGRGAPPDPARGCAYAQKASAARADAMFLVGQCRRRGVGGKPDPEAAKAAFSRAADMGFAAAKCALGQMLLDDPAQAARGVDLCRQGAQAGDVGAQLKLGDAYYAGKVVAKDRAEARRWYEMAARQGSPEASRKLGSMYAAGDGGKRDSKRAMELWRTAEKGGDPLTPILVADELFSQLTGGRTPGGGTYAFRGAIPVSDIEAIEDWYREAQQRDPRPETQKRAKTALAVLEGFRQGAQKAAEAGGR